MIDLSQCVAYLGAELILPGLDDLAARRVTIAACLVSIARPLMKASGLAAGIPEAAYIAEPQQTFTDCYSGKAAMRTAGIILSCAGW